MPPEFSARRKNYVLEHIKTFAPPYNDVDVLWKKCRKERLAGIGIEWKKQFDRIIPKGSQGKAADKIGITHPALSQWLDTGDRGTYPNGENFLEVDQQLPELFSDAARISRGIAGSIATIHFVYGLRSGDGRKLSSMEEYLLISECSHRIGCKPIDYDAVIADIEGTVLEALNRIGCKPELTPPKAEWLTGRMARWGASYWVALYLEQFNP
jgi:hypothetical protein